MRLTSESGVTAQGAATTVQPTTQASFHTSMNDFSVVEVKSLALRIRARIWRVCYRLRRTIARKWAMAARVPRQIPNLY